MKAICDGQKSRGEVVAETIEQYRAVYVRAQSRLDCLHTVSSYRIVGESADANNQLVRSEVCAW